MNNIERSEIAAVVVETDLWFSLDELAHACGVETAVLDSLIQEGVLYARGSSQTQWRFDGASLPRARTATRLLRDLELDAAGTALVLDLFDRIKALQSQVRQLGG